MTNLRGLWGTLQGINPQFSFVSLGENRQQQYIQLWNLKLEKAKRNRTHCKYFQIQIIFFKVQNKIWTYFSKPSFKHSWAQSHLGNVKARTPSKECHAQHPFQGCTGSPRKFLCTHFWIKCNTSIVAIPSSVQKNGSLPSWSFPLTKGARAGIENKRGKIPSYSCVTVSKLVDSQAAVWWLLWTGSSMVTVDMH